MLSGKRVVFTGSTNKENQPFLGRHDRLYRDWAI